MKEQSPAMAEAGRASRRAAYHLLQAVVESLKAIETVIEEIGAMSEESDQNGRDRTRQEIGVE